MTCDFCGSDNRAVAEYPNTGHKSCGRASCLKKMQEAVNGGKSQ